MHIRQAEVAALKTVGQPFVIDPEQMQKCRLKIVDMHAVARDIDPQIVALPVLKSGFDPAACHPD